jgi:hypothetical protein
MEKRSVATAVAYLFHGKLTAVRLSVSTPQENLGFLLRKASKDMLAMSKKELLDQPLSSTSD